MVQVALCQMGSVGTPEENMAEMERLFLQAVENSRAELDLIVFPEYCYYTPVDKDDARRIAIDVSRPHAFIDRMKELAREYHVNLIPGSFAAVAKDGKVSNHSIMLNREGEEIGFYDKIHLFDAAGYKESSYVAETDSPQPTGIQIRILPQKIFWYTALEWLTGMISA